MDKKIRVMFYADNYTATSGYSKVGRELAKRLAKDGRFDIYFQEVTSSAPITVIDGVKVLPCFVPRTDPLFLNVVAHHLRAFGPTVFLPICDTFLLKRDGIDRINFENIIFLPYMYFDCYNLPDFSEDILDKANKILTASNHGIELLKEGNYKGELLTNGVDFEKYKPVSLVQQEQYKLELGYEKDDYLFLFIGRNFPRKRPLRLLKSIAEFNKQNPDNNAKFLLHMSETDMNHWDLNKFKTRMEKMLDISMDNVKFSEKHSLGKGISEEEIIKYFNACDYYISTSSGEGFGLPIVEAMACKKVVIAADNTTHTDFLADGRGMLVENEGETYVGYGSKSPLVNIDKFTDALNTAYNMSDSDYNDIADKAFVWVRANCNWNKISDQLANVIIEEVQKKINNPEGMENDTKINTEK